MPFVIALLTAFVIVAAIIVAWPWIRLPRTENGDPDMSALACIVAGPGTIAACLVLLPIIWRA